MSASIENVSSPSLGLLEHDKCKIGSTSKMHQLLSDLGSKPHYLVWAGWAWFTHEIEAFLKMLPLIPFKENLTMLIKDLLKPDLMAKTFGLYPPELATQPRSGWTPTCIIKCC